MVKKINNWKITNDKPIRKFGRYYIEVQCTCGSNIKKLLPKHHLTSKLSRGCEKCSRFHTTKGVGMLSGQYWALVKSGALKRNLPFEVSIEYAWKLFIKQEGKCALSNILIEFEPNCVHNKHMDNRSKRTASFDRINSDKGYIKGNVQWVHKDVNLMKNHFDEDYFIKICKLICKRN